MSPVILVISLVLIAVIVFVAVMLIRNILAPKKVSGIKKLIKEGKYQTAEKIAKSVLAKNSRDYEAHYWLGATYMASEKLEQAYMEFKAVNDNAILDGSIPEIELRKNLTVLYQKYGEPEAALREYLLLTKLEPQNAENFYNAAKIYESQGDLSMAVGMYQKTISINKKHSKAHTALGYIYLKNKQYQSAQKEIDDAIRLEPDCWSNYYYHGKLLMETGNYGGALKSFEKSERAPEFRQKALIERGSCYMQAEDYGNAIQEFINAIQYSKDPNSSETLYSRYFLAACYEKTHDIDKALEQWEKINSKNSHFRDVPNKLQEYRDLQSNDNMKEYLTSSTADFVEVCKKIAAKTYQLEPKEIDTPPYGCSMICTEIKKDEWRNARPLLFMVTFYRDAEPVKDMEIRTIAEKLKEHSYYKAIIFSSSGFTNLALQYAETRPVILIDREHLETILSKAAL
ncbi:MAG: tetratricopeptide repeat protein [Treponema sp.]|nr:tetratricopeptide repeat protein [Treponema sp.]MBQ5385082.1 tetratricopeptide repeat protein [Treponema sp.]